MGAKDKVKSAVEGNPAIHRLVDTKGKRLAIAGVAAAAVIALAASFFLNANKDGGYVTLFPGTTREENIEILTVLNSRGVAAKRNSEGEVTVPESQFGDIMLEMSELGYPKTALPFDIFSDNMSFTTTEFEKRQYLLLNLQDRLERTLKDMSGIKNAIVTLNVSDESNYVWDDQASDSTGSVSLTMMPSYELSAEKVAAIKNLVANSVPRLQPESVTVVNAETMQEMVSSNLTNDSYYGLSRLDFEASVEERLVNKITNVLTLAYPPSKLRVSATVVIDYDKMITEDLQYEPQEDGSGVIEHYNENYSGTGVTGEAGGVAGEENNTDIPAYGTGLGTTEEGVGDYSRNVDYLVGYMKRQIEKDNVKLQKATVAITVNDDNLTAAKRQQLIEAASKAANIAPEDIVVSNFQIADTGSNVVNTDTTPVQGPAIGEMDPRLIIAGAAALFVLLLALFILLLRHNAKKNREEDQELFGGAVEAVEEENPAEAGAMAESQNENNGFQIDDSSSPVEKIRSFAKMNPQIIAAMLRLWLKEEEQEEE
ncbi:MAG: flagellar M-ring protein FliF [Hungatella hathewayi]|nr:flagellar M-ring protein FliF [Hungatella hathewayi]